jgi:DTW domain-containing protein
MRPERTCVCRDLKPLKSDVHVVIVQHPRERDKAIGTARLASLLIEGAELFVCERVAEHPALLTLLTGDGVALLYPEEGIASSLNENVQDAENEAKLPTAGMRRRTTTLSAREVKTLVVVDGTWWQAGKLLKLNAELRALPRYLIAPLAPSEYRIRREPAAHCLSTIEALALALEHLHDARKGWDAGSFRALREPFRQMVDHQIRHENERRQKLSDGGHREARKRLLRRRRFPDAFYEQHDRIVVATFEANAFPYDHPARKESGYEDELVQWSLADVANASSASCIGRPLRALGPRTGALLEIPEPLLERGVERDAMVRAWCDAVPKSAILCVWGDYGPELFKGLLQTALVSNELEKLERARQLTGRIDVRELVCRALQGRAGTLEDACARLGIVEPDTTDFSGIVMGRAARRLARLRALARYFVVEARKDALRIALLASPADAESHTHKVDEL